MNSFERQPNKIIGQKAEHNLELLSFEQLLRETMIQVDTEIGIAGAILNNLEQNIFSKRKATPFDLAKKEVYLIYLDTFKTFKEKLKSANSKETLANLLLELVNDIKKINFNFHQPMQEILDLISWAKKHVVTMN